jgi:hypothetical protein
LLTAGLLSMFTTEVVRQGELAGEKTRGCLNGIVCSLGYDQPTALFKQLYLAARFEPELAAKLPRNQNLAL